MTTKINGAAYPGVWVERKVAFVKITFNQDLLALDENDTYLLGTTTAPSATTVAASVFGVVESAVVQALKVLETKATVLAVSSYDATNFSIDEMLGNAEGWFSDANGVIATTLPVTNAQAIVTTGGVTPTTTVGDLLTVRPSAVTFDLEFAKFDGNMTIGTLANGALAIGPGATPGNMPSPGNTPTGAPGYYPAPV